jgi:YVTN family beta-propeller protein
MNRPIVHFKGLVFTIVLLISLAGPVQGQVPDETATTSPVGRLAENAYATPVNQLLTPAGRQVELPGLRPQAIALSPNGRILAVSGKTAELLLLDPLTATVVQRVALVGRTGSEAKPDTVSGQILHPDKDAQVSYTGLIFSPAGDRLYLSSVNGSIKVFAIDPQSRATPSESFPLPPVKALRRKAEIPAGLAISRDGKRLYVALNLSNRLAEMDTASGKVLRTWDVGVAPFDVVLARDKVYVSNWGGRRPEAGDLTGPAGQGTKVKVDPVRHIACEGSVSVLELKAGRVTREILAGLHASAMALALNRRWLVVANSASDTLSVIDTGTDLVIETIWARSNPADLFGAAPNALVFDGSGKRLFACNGTQNAVAVFDFAPGKSRLAGLIPVGWFPGALVFDDRRDSLYVANIKGIGSTKRFEPGVPIKYNSHQHFGTVSLVPVPQPNELVAQTQVARRNMRYGLLEQARLPARPGQPSRPVPERAGEPSVFKHVVYVIKENRTYDQILGDVPLGNGEPSLCVFGDKFTPNQHKMVRDFVLLDNTYCSGVLSADGHQWATTAMATDYMEKSFAGFPRSYPDGMGDDEVDALAYSPTGFIWDNALAHGKTLRDYGEFAITMKGWADLAQKRRITFLDHWRDFTNGTATIQIASRPGVETLRPYLCTNTVGWDLEIADQFRARQFIKEVKQFEAQGNFPNLVIICLPNDHTSGTNPGMPTPSAQVADNDLAFGQIVEALSHSRFWPETCIFAIEDDPQAGYDHVSGYRTTAYVVSPYTKRGEIVSTQYNQTSLIRTMELILGLPPMNQLDAVATPMFDCFTNTPDLTPFVAVPNQVALDEINPEPKKISDALLRRYARASTRLPLAAPDQCPEDLLNRIIWHSVKGSAAPYPVWAVTSEETD